VILPENRVLKRIFGPKREEVTGRWRTLNNEELHNLYSSLVITNVIRSNEVQIKGHTRTVSLGKTTNTCDIFV